MLSPLVIAALLVTLAASVSAKPRECYHCSFDYLKDGSLNESLADELALSDAGCIENPPPEKFLRICSSDTQDCIKRKIVNKEGKTLLVIRKCDDSEVPVSVDTCGNKDIDAGKDNPGFYTRTCRCGTDRCNGVTTKTLPSEKGRAFKGSKSGRGAGSSSTSGKPGGSTFKPTGKSGGSTFKPTGKPGGSTVKPTGKSGGSTFKPTGKSGGSTFKGSTWKPTGKGSSQKTEKTTPKSPKSDKTTKSPNSSKTTKSSKGSTPKGTTKSSKEAKKPKRWLISSYWNDDE